NARRLSFQGSLIDDTVRAEHGMRTPYIGKGVISDNNFSDAGPKKHLLTVRPPPFAGTVSLPAGTYTEQVVASENKFIGTQSAWSVTITPKNTQVDERLRDLIVERNWFVAGP